MFSISCARYNNLLHLHNRRRHRNDRSKNLQDENNRLRYMGLHLKHLNPDSEVCKVLLVSHDNPILV